MSNQIVNPWRAATAAVVCEMGIVVWLAGASLPGAPGAEKPSPPALARIAPLLAADIAVARPPKVAKAGNPDINSIDIVKAAQDLVTGTVAATTPLAPDEPKAVADEPKPVVVATAGDPSELLSSEPAPVIAPSLPDQAARDDDVVNSAAILDECPDVNLCIDRYLFALYERTRKEDTVKEEERRQVTVKRKGKMVTVTRTVSRLVDEDFGWKDAKASEKAEMPMIDYVIGGMDRNFKMKLFYMLQAAQHAGMQPGITSAFRDNYRQSIASGLKAASDRSYHGGSSHGGYGHGLAADVVSTNGATRAERQASSENFWKWIDTHKEFGIGRPYLDHDPPHVGAIDGEEYVKHRGARPVRAASGGKRAKTANSS
jgi:D-alanyl-D-alanine carboxypeptidase